MSSTNSRIVFSSIVHLAIVATIAGAFDQVQAQDAFASLDASMQPSAAEGMEQRAHDMILSGAAWGRAADLYLRAAELRGAADPQSADNLLLAGYIQFYSERPDAALLSLTEAGEAFLALGDVVHAAAAFIDGAWVAVQAGMSAEARDLGARAWLLTRSPLLRTDERLTIAGRLGAAPGME